MNEETVPRQPTRCVNCTNPGCDWGDDPERNQPRPRDLEHELDIEVTRAVQAYRRASGVWEDDDRELLGYTFAGTAVYRDSLPLSLREAA